MQTSYIRDITVNYVQLKEVDRFGNFSLQIEFGKERIDELKGYGQVKPLDNGNFAINLSTKPTYGKDTKKAGQTKDIPIINMSKETIEARIGNGSKAHLKVFTYKSDRAFNGSKTAPMAVMITEFKEYVAPTEDFDFVETTTTTEASMDF